VTFRRHSNLIILAFDFWMLCSGVCFLTQKPVNLECHSRSAENFDAAVVNELVSQCLYAAPLYA
jgi:hypothetical protein